MDRLFSFLPLVTLLIIFSVVISQCKPAVAEPLGPLHTDSRWIVNESGERVKLACVNWVSHLEPMLAEGLSQQPINEISKKIRSMGFNCVRFTWPLYLLTNETYSSVTVRQSFERLGLSQYIPGFEKNNPFVLDLPLVKAYQAVVSNLGAYDVMVIVDNHLTVPGWCCNNNDDNGFFGDKYFDPEVWINGWTKMASLFNGVRNVVGMSLRNEPRGPKQNLPDWYKYMQRGAEAVHSANPDVLVILSGLNYDTDLSFLGNKSLSLSFTGKLVLEAHRYGFTDTNTWKDNSANQACADVVGMFKKAAGFLLDQGYPLFVSEFGTDLRGGNVLLNRFMNCFLAMAADLDFEWNLWTLGGSYYTRQGKVGAEELYGILKWDNMEIRNSTFLNQLSTLQSPFQGSGLGESKNPHQLIFHPMTGLCVQIKSPIKPLWLGPCNDSEAWSYTTQNALTLKGTEFCLQAHGVGEPARLGEMCNNSGSQWEPISESGLHLSSTINNGTQVCLDVDSNHNVVTNACSCFGNSTTCNPDSQWFKIIKSARPPSYTKLDLL